MTLVFGASSDEYNENSVLCTCNPKGTKDNGTACNELTGECQCKPNVENRVIATNKIILIIDFSTYSRLEIVTFASLNTLDSLS